MNDLQRKLGPFTVDVAALLVGVQILTKAAAKLEDFGHHPVIVSVLLLLGTFVSLGAVLPLWLEKKLKNAHPLFHAAEGLAMSLAAILLFEKGKLRIPVILIGLGLVYFFLGYLESRPLERRTAIAARLPKVFGWIFVLAGIVLAAFTANRDHDAWAYGASALLVIMGVGFLFCMPILLRSASETTAATPHGEGSEAH